MNFMAFAVPGVVAMVAFLIFLVSLRQAGKISLAAAV
jgi:AAHS family benzoate transporter-like MFS transporter